MCVSLAPLCVLQDEVKLPSKLSISKSLKEGEKLEKEGEETKSGKKRKMSFYSVLRQKEKGNAKKPCNCFKPQ